MQLYYFLAIIVSLSFGSVPKSDQPLMHAIGFSAAVIATWWILCGLSVRLVSGQVHQGEISLGLACDWFDRQTEILRWFSLALIVLCLGGFGLGRSLDRIPIVCDSMLLQSLVLLSPALLMMLGVWMAEYAFSVFVGAAQKTWGQCMRFVWTAFRFSCGWLIVPIMLLFFLVDVGALLSIGIWFPSWLGWGLLVVAAMIGTPALVKRMFPTTSIDDSTQQWLHSIMRHAGLAGCRLVIWDTGNRAHNAMIAGLCGRFRVLVLSDRLIQELSREQLAMVVLHEVAHVKRFHVPLRILSLLPAWMLAMMTQSGANMMADWQSELAALAAWSATISSMVGIIATAMILRWVSYRIEFDADRFACRSAATVARHVAGVPVDQSTAQRSLADALRCVSGPASSGDSSWLHPAINDRVDAIASRG